MGRISRSGRFAVVAATTAAALMIGSASAQAEEAVALLPGNVIASFDTATPATIDTAPVTGLGINHTLRGIDVRPVDGRLYAQGVITGVPNNSIVFTYVIDPETAQATLVGQTAASVAGAGDVPGGYDFNPAVSATTGTSIDRMRYVNTNDENARLNPNTGTLAGNDTDLTPAATTDIVGAAYDRNASGPEAGSTTTLFEIDRNSSTLSIQGGPNGIQSPNQGIVTDFGSLGVALTAGSDAGFDISPSGNGFATLTVGGVTGLYTLNFNGNTATATLVGNLGNGTVQTYSLAILQPDSDGDGLRDAADNCPNAANAGQADLDADGTGDPCDADEDGDGLSNGVEAAIGSDPRSTNSDGDGLADGADSCPTLKGTEPNGCPDVKLPNTKITKGPTKQTSKHTAKLKFRSTEEGSSFACSLDGKAFKPCKSPKRYKNLKSGKRSFEVRAIDAAGNLDPTPAALAWRIKGGKAGANRASARGGTGDTTPPEPYIRARKRQDKNTALKKGIQTTCGTEDDERPVTCTMSASLKGELVARETDEIVAPFNRVQFHLKVDKKVKHEIRATEKSVTIKLFLEVEDEAGNVGTANRKTKLVKDLFG